MTGDVLVLRALGVGDLLVTVPALRGLRAAFPDARITLAAPAALDELAALTGAVDRVLPTPGLGALRWTGAPPAVAVNLHGSGPESVTDLLGTRPGRLLSHRHPDFPDLDGPEWREDQHEVLRWCRMLACHGIAADRHDLALARPDVPSPAGDAIVVHPGAAFESRRWPPGRFAEVAREFARAGSRVVVTGSAAERDLAGRVAAAAGLGEDAVLAGRTSLTELAALVSGARLVISGDTGVAHLATAYRTPSVLLFGPTPPWRWGPPPGTGDRHVVLWAGEAGDPFADAPAPGLLRITVDEVVAAGRSALRPVVGA
ncbi:MULTISPECIES: glycosyltransferase family 9 protein [Amycolatopsis]|uniref:glycosyltransferase family 9 protein n=1 Tax=Amycolatopsis TaxID=1813 RepID=UPI000B8A8ED5|nr:MULTISPECIES: glycosyltransferase family 9 protein [Amycolatopsis]OXM71779.1 glycosyl transferase [Amycolatopsis sp. KNN50.9b]